MSLDCWYILDSEPGTQIVIGHHAKDKEELMQMVEEKRWKDLIREVPVKKGDFYQIDPGCVHAIKGGTVILHRHCPDVPGCLSQIWRQ